MPPKSQTISDSVPVKKKAMTLRPGMTFLTPVGSIDDDLRFIAAMFGKPMTSTLRTDIFEDPALKRVINRVTAWARTRFGLDPEKWDSKSTPAIGHKEVMAVVRKHDFQMIKRLVLPMPPRILQLDEVTQIVMVHNVAIAMNQLIEANPSLFIGGGAMQGDHSADDWFRAWAVVRHHIRRETHPARYSGPSRAFPAEHLQYPVEGMHGDEAGAVPYGTGDALADEERLSDIPDLASDDDLPRIPQYPLNPGESMDEAFTRIERQLAASDRMATLGLRPSMTKAQRDQVARFVKKNYVKVISLGLDPHATNPTMPKAITQGNESAQAEEVLSLEGEGMGEKTMSPQQIREFLEFRAKLETGQPDNVPSYKEACQMMNIDPVLHDLRIPQGDGLADKVIKLNPWQIIAIGWMVRMDADDMDALLADDCGLGKTLTVLGFIYHKRRLIKEKTLVAPFRPCVIFAPSAVCSGWYNEIRKFFGTGLRVFLFYGSKSEKMDNTQRAHTLRNTAEDLVEDVQGLDKNNEDTACSVYITSYQTAYRRLLRINGLPTSQFQSLNKRKANQHYRQKKQREAQQAAQRTGAGLDGNPPALTDGADPDGPADPNLTSTRMDDDDELEGPAEDADHVYSCMAEGLFDTAICDESHGIKNPHTYKSKVVYLTKARRKYFLSATPIANATIDLYGVLVAFWNPKWRAEGEDAKRAHYHPRAFFGLPPAPKEGIDTTVDAAAMPDGTGPTSFSRMHLDPAPFYALIRNGQLDPGIAQYVLPKIFRQICLRRTFSSFVDLEDGGPPVRVGADLPPYVIRTVELAFRIRDVENEFDDFYEKTAAMYVKSGVKGDEKAVEPDHGTEDVDTLRGLGLLSTSVALLRFVRVMKANGVKEVNEWFHDGEDNGMSTLWQNCGFGDNRHMPPPTSRVDFVIWLCMFSPKLAWLVDYVNQCKNEGEPVLIFVDYPLSHWLVEGVLCMMQVNVRSIRSAFLTSERDEAVKAFNNKAEGVEALVCSFRTAAYGLNIQERCSRVVHVELPGAMSAILQANGRVYRIGQKKAQEIFILTLDHSFDLIQQGKLSAKFLGQLIGTVEMPPFPDDIVSLADLEERKNAQDEFLNAEADKLVQQMLGQRHSRLQYAHIDPIAPPNLQQYPPGSLAFEVFDQTPKTRHNYEKRESGKTAPRTPRPGRPDFALSKATITASDDSSEEADDDFPSTKGTPSRIPPIHWGQNLSSREKKNQRAVTFEERQRINLAGFDQLRAEQEEEADYARIVAEELAARAQYEDAAPDDTAPSSTAVASDLDVDGRHAETSERKDGADTNPEAPRRRALHEKREALAAKKRKADESAATDGGPAKKAKADGAVTTPPNVADSLAPRPRSNSTSQSSTPRKGHPAAPRTAASTRSKRGIAKKVD